MRLKLAVAVAALVMGLGAEAPVALAQATFSTENGRNCQTIRQCNFKRGGVFRGCISAYSCRRCKTVRERCRNPRDGRRICTRVVCPWAGA